ncbi:MAG: type II methionyl aminopeptidase [Candidatus Altiarchaeota archaeon]|nr:type II methionyl aminopeptidase [Candidatus Altiarchaeota archaeon]
MDTEELDAYKTAGRIASEIREWSKTLVKPGAGVLDIAEKIESRIKELECGIAFPVNTCINDVAAHYAPKFNDQTVIGEADVVTVDLGVHVDGFIADTAYTMDLSGDYSEMLKANEEALENAMGLVKPGVSVSEIGRTVKETLVGDGFKPIENLTGHEIKQYDLHAGLSIPSIEVPYDWRIEEGMVLAIEPFATDGCGRVIESKHAEIFSLLESKPTRMREARVLLNEVEKRKTLPFAGRWFAGKINPLRLSLVLRDLVSSEVLKAHPVLHEKEKGIVSQFEHTMIVTSDGCEVTTR